jgi:hypothetical protein
MKNAHYSHDRVLYGLVLFITLFELITVLVFMVINFTHLAVSSVHGYGHIHHGHWVHGCHA